MGKKVRFKIILILRIGQNLQNTFQRGNSSLDWSRKNQCANTRWLDSGVYKSDPEVLRTKYELIGDPAAKKTKVS